MKSDKFIRYTKVSNFERKINKKLLNCNQLFISKLGGENAKLVTGFNE